jgi:hypothetical protein
VNFLFSYKAERITKVKRIRLSPPPLNPLPQGEGKWDLASNIRSIIFLRYHRFYGSRPRPLLQEQRTSEPDFHELVLGQALPGPAPGGPRRACAPGPSNRPYRGHPSAEKDPEGPRGERKRGSSTPPDIHRARSRPGNFRTRNGLEILPFSGKAPQGLSGVRP